MRKIDKEFIHFYKKTNKPKYGSVSILGPGQFVGEKDIKCGKHKTTAIVTSSEAFLY